MLLIDDLRFRYSSRTVQYLFSLTLHRGEIATIHGKSGCGKSTLLDLIAGFLRPNSGQLSWLGDSFINRRPKDRPVTSIFQRNNLFEHLSAVDNVLIGLDPTLRKKGTHYRESVEALEHVGLASHTSQRVATLSGGQRQRVAIARASLQNKGIVLLDEPFSALDPATREEMLQIVQQISRVQQSAIIMVTHDQRDADAIADKRYLLQDGTLLLQNSPIT